MRIIGWISNVSSSDLGSPRDDRGGDLRQAGDAEPDVDGPHQMAGDHDYPSRADRRARGRPLRSRDLSMVKLNKIYTRTGDGGTTGLVDGSRIAKSAPLMAAIGDIDEANSAVGLAAAALSADSGEAAMLARIQNRSEEHTSELQSLMRISYAVLCLKKKNQKPQ